MGLKRKSGSAPTPSSTTSSSSAPSAPTPASSSTSLTEYARTHARDADSYLLPGPEPPFTGIRLKRGASVVAYFPDLSLEQSVFMEERWPPPPCVFKDVPGAGGPAVLVHSFQRLEQRGGRHVAVYHRELDLRTTESEASATALVREAQARARIRLEAHTEPESAIVQLLTGRRFGRTAAAREALRLERARAHTGELNTMFREATGGGAPAMGAWNSVHQWREDLWLEPPAEPAPREVAREVAARIAETVDTQLFEQLTKKNGAGAPAPKPPEPTPEPELSAIRKRIRDGMIW
jgi:hypothetical protein